MRNLPSYDVLISKVLIFGVFVVTVLWLLVLLLRRDLEQELQGPEVYTVENGKVQVYILREWRKKMNGL
jgi:hypothetical protein